MRDAKYEALIAAAPDAIISIDACGIVVDFNPAAERIFGYEAHEIVGRNVSLLMPDPYRNLHDSFLERYLRTGENQVIGIGREVRAVRKDGRIFPMDLSVCEVTTESDHLFIGIVRDISPRKALDLRLVEEQRNAVDGQLQLLRRCSRLEQENSELRQSQAAATSTGDLLRAVLSASRILAADDDADSRFLIKRFLESAGAVVDTVVNGLEAIEAVNQGLRQGVQYAAIVLDLHMPVMDGRRTAVELRRLGYAGPLLALTADVFGQRELPVEKCGYDACLFKPINKSALIQGLQRQIELGEQRGGLRG
ncbi:PAS domain S-box protein [Planctellipticum variicoloris]|uniref:PAS domain S-box protein n=1 Tax=Planctellipticum variicoloris TaxID=3064265 RepID=UPI003013B9F6|nr:PAS domain S-box protein [Planctomycetaceae bacterium SH412]